MGNKDTATGLIFLVYPKPLKLRNQLFHKVSTSPEYSLPTWSLRPRDAHMRQQMRPSLVQIMACPLIGTKPLSEPMPDYWHLDTQDKLSVKSESY